MSVSDSLFGIARQIEESTIGAAIAESQYLFMIIEGVHLIGLAIAAGLIAIADLRLMHLILRRVPVFTVLTSLRPYILGGFLVIFLSGGLLFWSAAERVMNSPAFAFKMLLIAVGGLNAAWFELALARRHRNVEWHTPRSFRIAGFISLLTWSLVIVFGRLIPYLPSWSGAPDAYH